MKIIKIPSSQGGLGKANGAEKAPDEIVRQLEKINLSEGGLKPVFEAAEAEVVQGNIESTNDNIYESAKKELKENQSVVFLGGDHSVSFPILKAFSELNRNPGLIMFDAHADCANNFEPATHEDFIRVIVEKDMIKPENIVLVGLRNIHSIELKFLRDNRIKCYTMKEISYEGINAVCDAVMAAAKDWGALHVSVDIDVVDPAFAPGTGYCEPSGLTSRELVYFLQRIKLLRNLKSADLTEVNPEKDTNEMTSKLGAKIIAELL